jgi:hypothetical protein
MPGSDEYFLFIYHYNLDKVKSFSVEMRKSTKPSSQRIYALQVALVD